MSGICSADVIGTKEMKEWFNCCECNAINAITITFFSDEHITHFFFVITCYFLCVFFSYFEWNPESCTESLLEEFGNAHEYCCNKGIVFGAWHYAKFYLNDASIYFRFSILIFIWVCVLFLVLCDSQICVQISLPIFRIHAFEICLLFKGEIRCDARPHTNALRFAAIRFYIIIIRLPKEVRFKQDQNSSREMNARKKKMYFSVEFILNMKIRNVYWAGKYDCDWCVLKE